MKWSYIVESHFLLGLHCHFSVDITPAFIDIVVIKKEPNKKIEFGYINGSLKSAPFSAYLSFLYGGMMTIRQWMRVHTWFDHLSLYFTHANCTHKCNSLDGIIMFHPWLLGEVGVLGSWSVFSSGLEGRHCVTDLVASGVLCTWSVWFFGRAEIQCCVLDLFCIYS